MSTQFAPKKLTNEERLEIENLYLKVENLRLQQERLQLDLQNSVLLRQQLQKEMVDKQASLSEKYGVEFASCVIRPDGTIEECRQ